MTERDERQQEMRCALALTAAAVQGGGAELARAAAGSLGDLAEPLAVVPALAWLASRLVLDVAELEGVPPGEVLARIGADVAG